MSYSINGNVITLTRGDSLHITLSIANASGESYVPSTGDTIRFAMKKNYSDSKVLLSKSISTSTLRLDLAPSDTKSLPFDKYVYDIQLTKSNGDVDTFIKGKLVLTEEVD